MVKKKIVITKGEVRGDMSKGSSGKPSKPADRGNAKPGEKKK